MFQAFPTILEENEKGIFGNDGNDVTKHSTDVGKRSDEDAVCVELKYVCAGVIRIRSVVVGV